MCFTPLLLPERYKNLKNVLQPATLVPCGKCSACIKKRISGWSFRLKREALTSLSAYFITLTYDAEHIPITHNGYTTTSKRDVQLFVKKLRKKHGSNHRPLKYFCVGEYGGTRGRPHYHLLLFNADIKLMCNTLELKQLKYSNYDGKTHVRLQQWQHGTATFGTFEDASIAYCFKYLQKGFTQLHQTDDRQPNFSLMSKGLGACYISNSIKSYHKAAPDRMYLNIENGKKIAMPRYYKDRIYTDYERGQSANLYKTRAEAENQKFFHSSQYSVDEARQTMAKHQANLRMKYREKLTTYSIT